MLSSTSPTSISEMNQTMNATLQSGINYTSPPNTKEQEEHIAKIVIITVALCCSILLLAILVLCCKRIFLIRRRGRYKQSYWYSPETRSKSKVSFLFESGSIIELDDKIDARSDDLDINSLTSRLLVPDASSYTDEILPNAHLSTFFRGIPTMKIDKSRLSIKETHRSLLELDIIGDSPVHRENDIPHAEPRVMKVKPLLAPDKKNKEEAPVQTLSVFETLQQHLDWNKVFNFLVYTINPATWKLFFVDLFGYGQHLLRKGMRINSIIDRVELSNKGATVALFFALFEEWLKLMGPEASPKQIENALEERGDNDALERFKDFMRSPPLMPKESEQSRVEHHFQENLHLAYPNLDMLKFNPKLSGQSPLMQVMALHNVIHTQSCNDVCGSLSQSQNATRTVIKGLPASQSNQEFIENVSMALSKVPNGGTGKCPSEISNGSRGKRQREDFYFPFTSDDEDVPCKCRKYDSNALSVVKRIGSKRKGIYRRSAYSCKELVQWEKIGDDFIIELIKRLLPSESQVLKSEEYCLFLYHTVTTIIKKTGVSEKVVLSVLLEDFTELHEYKTKRGHITYIIDTSACVLTLDCEECEVLKLYADYARPRVIRRLVEENSEYVKSKYLFIDYDGNPVAEKSFRNNQNKEARTEAIMKSIPIYDGIGNIPAAHCSQDEHSDQSLRTTESVDSLDSDSREAWILSQTAETIDRTAVLPSGNSTTLKDFEYKAGQKFLENITPSNSKDTLKVSNPGESQTSCDDEYVQAIAFPNDRAETNVDIVYAKGEMKQDVYSLPFTEENVKYKTPAFGGQADDLSDMDVKDGDVQSFIDNISELLSNDKMS
ncbi:uncharacterized protein LOC128551097 isoform X2 [Mercenaria mercenaria]|nr:uncharacterized protein LOC128551097 isoform X2 [Mercenaria mercenaria]